MIQNKPSTPRRGFLAGLSRLPRNVGGFLTRDRKPRTVYLAAFFLPFVVIFAYWACYGVWPFGSKMILAHDQWHQYYPFYQDLRTRLLEGRSLLHTWTTGMGTPYLPLFAYYLASPMNLVAALLPESLVMPYYTLTVLLKISLAGLFCAVFFQKTFRRPNLMIPFFSTAYALCAYIMGYYWNAIWLDTVALLPLVTLGTFSLMRDRKYLLFTVSLTLAIFCNYYIGLFVCIFVLLLFVCYNVVNWDDLAGFFSRLWRIALFSLLAIAMTAVVTIPTYLSLQSTSAGDSKFPDRYGLNMTEQHSSHKRMDAKTVTVKGDEIEVKSDEGISFRIISYSDGSLAFCDDDRYLTASGENQVYFNSTPSAAGRWYPEKEGDGFRLRCAAEKNGKSVYLVYKGGFTSQYRPEDDKTSVFQLFQRITPEADKDDMTYVAPKTVEYRKTDRLRSGMRAIVLLENGSRAVTTKERSKLNLRAVLDALQTVLANTGTTVVPTSFNEKTPNIFCGFAVIMLAILFCFCRRISLRERICCVGLLLLFSCSMIFKVADYVWHGLHVPNMLPFRYSFLWSFVAIYMAYRLYLQIFRIRWWHLLLMLLPLAVFIYCIIIVHQNLRITVATLAVTAFIGTFLVLYSLRIVRKEVFSLALALCMLGESVVCAGLGVSRVAVTDSKSYPVEGKSTAAVVEKMKKSEEDNTDLWRAEVAKKYTLNDSTLLNYRGVSAFSSTVNSRTSQFLQSIGLASSVAGNRYSYQEADPFTNLLLGVKYVIDREGRNTNPAYFEEVASDGKVLLLKNKAYLPLGFMVNENTLEYRPVDEKGNSYANQPYDRLNTLFREMSGIETPLFTKFDADSVDTFGSVELNAVGTSRFNFTAEEANSLKNCVGVTFTMPQDGMLCIYSRSLDCADILVAVNGQSLYYYSDKYGYNRCMGEFRQGDKINLYYRAASAGFVARVTVLQAAIFRTDVFDEGLQQFSASSMMTTRVTDTEIEGAIQVEKEGLIYLSVPYDDGWKLEVDGTHAKIVPVGGAMIAARLTPGVHAIHLYYVAPGFHLGRNITLGALVIFAVLVILALLLRLTRPPIDKVPMTLEDPEGDGDPDRPLGPEGGEEPVLGPELTTAITMPPLDPDADWQANPEDTLRFDPAALPAEMPELIPETDTPTPGENEDLPPEERLLTEEGAAEQRFEAAAPAPSAKDDFAELLLRAEANALPEQTETPAEEETALPTPEPLREDRSAEEETALLTPEPLPEDRSAEEETALPAPEPLPEDRSAEEETALPTPEPLPERIPEEWTQVHPSEEIIAFSPEASVPVWNEDPAPAAPVWNGEPAPAAPVWNEEPAPAAPVWNEEPAPAAPVWNEEPAPAAPVWNEEPAPAAPVWNGDPAPAVPVWNEEPAPAAPVWNGEPAPAAPVWNEDPAPAAPVWNGEPAPAAPVWNEEPAPAAPVWNEDPATAVPLGEEIPIPGWTAEPETPPQPTPKDPNAFFSTPGNLDF